MQTTHNLHHTLTYAELTHHIHTFHINARIDKIRYASPLSIPQMKAAARWPAAWNAECGPIDAEGHGMLNSLINRGPR